MASGGIVQSGFRWGPQGQRLSPQEIARRRALAESLAPTETPRDYWSGISSAVRSIGSALHNWQADESERSGRSEYQELANALLADPSNVGQAELMQLMMHDFASPQGSALASALFSDQLRRSDPLYQLNLERGNLELEALRNPWQAQPATPDQLSPWGIDASAGGSWVIGPDGLPQQVYAPADPLADAPAAFQTLDLRARAAGLEPGTPEYQQFMAEGGGASLTENERQIAALVQRGFSQAEAEDLAYGFVQTVVDPVLQSPMIVNRTTGEGRYITPEEAAIIVDTFPSAAGGVDQPSPVPAQEQSPFDSAFGAVDGATDPALQQTMDAQRPTLWDIAEGSTGVVPSLQEGWTNIAGQFGASGFEDVVENRQMFDLEKNNLIRALSINPRFPVGEIERLEREINISPGAWNSANSMRARMIAINSALSSRLENEIRVANDPAMPAEARRNALQAANDIRNFLTTLGVPEGANAATGRGAGDAAPNDRPPLETFMRQ